VTPELQRAVEELIASSSGKAAAIVGRSGASGGCISVAEHLQLEDGRRYFLKSNAAPLPGLFERECVGLAALEESGTLRVPVPLGTGGAVGSGVLPFIVMEAIAQGNPSADFFDVFGRSFAELHRITRADAFGFNDDNYLGATPQPNPWTRDWCEFWREHRLGFQLRLARKLGHADPELNRLGDRLLGRLEEYLGEPNEPPCLLHGDLWSGNFLADDSGQPVLIDPAAYYGRREADLAMTLIFGGFSRRFYAAYEEVWPLADGAQTRLEIYKLYHLLNHLNLFGASYRGQCLSTLKRFA
jgi:protein-ribulosamine 3-kinase